MKILALEFSSEQRSVAIMECPGVGESCTQLSASLESGARSLQAMVLVDAALREAKLSAEEIECVAVGLGPGSYTGIRVAIALAQGWQLARKVKLAGVSSAECLAAQAHREGLTGQVAIVIDAQRNEFYLAVYELLAIQRQILEPLHLATFAEVKKRMEQCQYVIGPEVTRWFQNGRQMSPKAFNVAELALKGPFVTGERLEPIYLRPTTFVKAPPPRKIS